jgi:hypothetical protein
MLKQIITPEDKFFATAMRSPQGRMRLEKALRRSRIYSIIGGLVGIGFVALTAATVANEFRNQIIRPNEDLSGAIRSSLLAFGLSIAFLGTFAVRWQTLTTELKFITAWPSLGLNHSSESAIPSTDKPHSSTEEVRP